MVFWSHDEGDYTMMCPCGGFCVEGSWVRGPVKLEFQKCPDCGRYGNWRLVMYGKVVERGEAARNAFEDVENANK